MRRLARQFTQTLALAALVLGIFVSSRALVRMLPGDPLETLIAETGTSLPREALQEELGLGTPFWPSLARDARGWLHGDWGKSLFSRQEIRPLLSARLGNSVVLAGLATLIAFALAIPLGTLSAGYRAGQMEQGAGLGRWADRLTTIWGASSAAMPTPWVGPMLALGLGVHLGWFDVSGSLGLPVLTLALGAGGTWARLVRDRCAEALHTDSARSARARGLADSAILRRYGFYPASGAVLAFIVGQLGHLMAGAFVVEVLFDRPGMGELFVESVLRRDYPVVEACAFVTAMLSLVAVRAGDWVQLWIDPRIGASEERA